jgi:hypothetical protein
MLDCVVRVDFVVVWMVGLAVVFVVLVGSVVALILLSGLGDNPKPAARPA